MQITKTYHVLDRYESIHEMVPMNLILKMTWFQNIE